MNEYDPIAPFYDADHADFHEDVPFYRELARRTGGPVLEAMCGSGRLLVPLAQAGIDISGCDTSPAMLALARQRLAAAKLPRVWLYDCDVRTPLPGGPYALAIIALNSFMHMLTVEDQHAALQACQHALQPGGLLAIDLFNPNPRLLADYNNELVFDKTFYLPDGSAVQKYVAQQIDAAEQRSYVLFNYDMVTSAGLLQRHSLHLRMRWVYRYELEHLLARCGFELEQVYGSYDLDEYMSDSDVMLAVARRV